MKTINEIRHDFLEALARDKITMAKVSRDLGIPQPALSYFKNNKRGLSGKTLLKLLPFIYREKGSDDLA